MESGTKTAMDVERRRWLVPDTLLLVSLAWIGGHFGDDAHGVGLAVVVGLLHLVPVLVVAAALVAGAAGQPGPVWQRPLLAVAFCVKALTVFAIVWGLTHATGFGPRSVLDWVPIGAANAGGGLVLLAFIRGRRSRVVVPA